MRILWAVVLVLAAAACDALPFSPPVRMTTQTVVIEDEEGRTTATVTVIDDSGLVIGARQAELRPLERDAAIGNEGPRELWLVWESFACDDAPEVHVDRSGSALRVVVDTGPRPPGGCDSIGERLGIVLTLSEEVRAADVDLRFQRPVPFPD
jgi:hypothetical protein